MIANEYFTPTPITILRILPPQPPKKRKLWFWSSVGQVDGIKTATLNPPFLALLRLRLRRSSPDEGGFRLKTLESVETYILLMVHRPENQLRLVVYLPFIYMGFKNIPTVVGLGISEASTSINLQPIESPLIFCSDLQCLWVFNSLYLNTWSVGAALFPTLFGSHFGGGSGSMIIADSLQRRCWGLLMEEILR